MKRFAGAAPEVGRIWRHSHLAGERANAPTAPRRGRIGTRRVEGAAHSATIPTMDIGKPLAVLVTVGFSLLGILGDYFLKLASDEEHSLRTPHFYIGFAVYASTAFGWVFVMKHLKLATIGVLYSVSMVLLLTAVGVGLFRESLSYAELAGIMLAVASLVLLMRFA